MAGDPRRRGRPSKTQIGAVVRDAGKVRERADRSRREGEARFKYSASAFAAVQGAIVPNIIIPGQFGIDAAISHKIVQYASAALGQVIIRAVEKGSDPRKAIAAHVVANALTRLNAEVGGKIPTAAIPVIAAATAELISRNDVISTIIALGAVANLAREVEGKRRALPLAKEADGETGWEVAARRLAGSAAPSRAPSAVSPSPAARGVASSGATQLAAQAKAARAKIRPAVAPAFAKALDTAVNPDLILGYVRKRGGAADLPGLRHAWVATAAGDFAAEFVRTIGSAPKGTSENLALGAIIASALAQTGQRFPLVPPGAVPAVSVLIHKTLQPRLPALARMAATIAVAPASRPAAAASREMAW
ncbi:hypothetical protein [Sphingomonas sp. S2-65]|uniref:hypothetical protein n=1 Tax=Sphingomonas sp. S2-65 TaxID=2903960 RepID=UPI001F2D8506|nr:hypothetical protein [Sphingomonas sp. S2-65]UYY57242.1 hypothetical protein LZ586_11140 [Sphingomonas sp. S2-65]